MKILKKILIGMLQIAGLYLFAEAMGAVAKLLRIPLPGSMLAMIALFLLLQFGIVKMGWIEIGANFLMAELLLFFIPSAVGMVKYRNLLVHNGPEILVVILISLIAAMACSGWLADKIANRRSVKMRDR
ncbi:CidA/LrgA family holin-like protein [Weizmannia coagulans]|uniref:CidA/LrgA family holin-like protein n=1 Tax=Heyndrickxia coagulans TaxID=1398 RepID=A0AAW7CLA6_HEYCO|nr:CidA/LrgA family holin-like protein [Heyndrickxia coagulans]MDL5041633.1 CidA/LrgA family holin-like protein [Heyndrickxia coagulans]MED4967428.1 CidA/LrgA family holin-like protein [Heyndrickxia coagulans]